MKKNKIVLFVLALILLVGIIIVCVNGFNVSLDLRAHDTLKFVFDHEFKMEDITKVCDDVFKEKEYEVKTVEVFSDAVYIISPTIGTNEEEALLEKLNKLYVDEEKKEDDISDTETQTEIEGENTELTIFEQLEEGSKYDLYHDSKVRIRDIVKPYIMPSTISAIIIIIYIAIKYRKLNKQRPFITVCKTLGEILVVLLEVMSIIAIIRIPFTSTIIPVVMFIIVVSLCIKFIIYERQLKELEE